MPRGQYDREAARLRKEGRAASEVPSPPEPTYTEPAPAAASAPVRLKEAHGFINEYGAVYFKTQGAVITNPVEIAMLRGRGALLEEI